MFGRRADATLVRDLPMMRRFMPYVSPRRNDSLFYMMSEFQVDAALEYLEKKNRDRPPDRPMTLFHLFLRSTSYGLHLRPGVNRFVKGRKLWQRDGVYLTFSAKKEIVDGSPLITIKRRFDANNETLEEMVDSIYDKLLRGRSGRKTTSDKEMNLLMVLPGFAVRATMGALRVADELGLLPRSMIDADPLFTSVFIANLGSINYPAGFHHLWEYGTASVFGVMGKIETRDNGSRTMSVAWTYDERIEDGLYSYITLESIRKRIENPELLEVRADDLKDA
jgi:hypothetical protein